MFCPKKRLFSGSIGRKDEASRLEVEESDGEHSIDAVEDALAPLGVPFEDDLGVRARSKAPAEFFEFVPELEVIVDLAIEDDDGLSIRRPHRLRSPLGQID